MNRPISIISYDPPEYQVNPLHDRRSIYLTTNVQRFLQETLKENEVLDTSRAVKRYSTLINGNSAEDGGGGAGGVGELPNETTALMKSRVKAENKLLQNMSSGLGTTSGDSKG